MASRRQAGVSPRPGQVDHVHVIESHEGALVVRALVRCAECERLRFMSWQPWLMPPRGLLPLALRWALLRRTRWSGWFGALRCPECSG